MTATLSAQSPAATLQLPSTRWHRPLLLVAASMGILTIVCLIGLVVDQRTLLGVNVWEKPLKFAFSTIIYCVTWAWLIGQLQRFRRLTWWAGTVSAILLVVELAIIAGASAFGFTSHFNVSTPFHTALWAIMAVSISTLWVATFVVSIVLFRNSIGDRARALAIRAGALIALVGMALAFLMTSPTTEQLGNWQGIAGAHAVGVDDGGAGLPFLGWSTVAGDLRIPHFVGMHSLQVIPIALIFIEVLARRITRLQSVTARFRLVALITATYAAVLAILTWQALRGQSIVHPDASTVAVTAAVAAAALVAALVWLRRPQP